MSNVESTRTSTNQKTSGNQNNTKFMKFKKPSEPPQTNIKCGIINKGNTCYINASLQSFSSMVELWINFALLADTLSPFALSFVRIMSMLRQLWIHPSSYFASRTLQLSLEKKVLICLSSKMVVRSCLMYLKSYVGSHLMHRKYLQPP